MVDKVEMLPYEIQPARVDVVRLGQITDSHIFAEPDGRLLGLNTRDSFEAVCDRLMREEWRPDAILATGDLSQDASPEAYEYLADYFQTLEIPTFWTPGNHDSPEVMEKHLSRGSVLSAKQLLIGQWQVILLDSSVKGKVHGHLSDAQLSYLENALKRYPERYALVCLHHQPVVINSEWLDQIGLQNSKELKTLISGYERVKGVLWGHIHQDFQYREKGVEWIATPSSCVQFEPGSEDFSAGTEAPGYRYLNLYSDGRIESVVHRIDHMEFTVDYTIKGY